MGHGCEGHHGGWHGRGHHGGHRHGGGCGCGQHRGFRRRFWTKEERIAWLESYLENLQAEAQAVEEKIAKMKEGG